MNVIKKLIVGLLVIQAHQLWAVETTAASNLQACVDAHKDCNMTTGCTHKECAAEYKIKS